MYYLCIVMCFRVKLNLELEKLKDESRLDFSAPVLLPLAHFIVNRVHFMHTYINFLIIILILFVIIITYY